MRTERISCIVSIAMLCIAALVIAPFAAYGADKLIVQDSSSNTQFDVTDTGTLILPTATGKLGVGTATPLYLGDFSGNGVSESQLHFSLSGADSGGYITSAGQNNFFVSSGAAWNAVAGGWVAKAPAAVVAGSGAAGYRIFLANNCTVGSVCAGLNTAKFVIDYSGNVTANSYNLSSSRALKDNIQDLNAQKAIETLKELDPVTFNYKIDPEQQHVGFIAEDVPTLVATRDRKTLNTMDIVGVLTKVVQEQNKTIDALSATVTKLEAKLNRLESKDVTAQK
ncbi:MAG: tail fiber domain-containing protein [Dissulfurispiraceae bacterium]